MSTNMQNLPAANPVVSSFRRMRQSSIQYMREMIVNSGDMSIVSDSHTRYGTQGSVSIGEGGPELAKAMLGKIL